MAHWPALHAVLCQPQEALLLSYIYFIPFSTFSNNKLNSLGFSIMG